MNSATFAMRIEAKELAVWFKKVPAGNAFLIAGARRGAICPSRKKGFGGKTSQ